MVQVDPPLLAGKVAGFVSILEMPRQAAETSSAAMNHEGDPLAAGLNVLKAVIDLMRFARPVSA